MAVTETGPVLAHKLVEAGVPELAAPMLVGISTVGGSRHLAVEEVLPPGRWRDEITGATHEGSVVLPELWSALPVALLTRAGP